jgi:hypothetical protein
MVKLVNIERGAGLDLRAGNTPPPCARPKAFCSPLRMASFFAALLFAGLCAPHASAQIPRGIFSLAGSGQKASASALANPDVVGVTIRQNWADLEPTEGQFDFTFLDSEVARATTAGKQILLRINTQAAKPAWVTAAIQQAGGTFFTFDDNGVPATIPVFWDPTFLAKKKAMITALGAHLSGSSALKIVATSFANAISEDWSVPHTPPEVLDWFAAGYTTAKLLDAGKQIIDTTMAAFPNQYVTLAIGGNGHVGGTGNLDPTATYVAENAIATARASWPGRLIAQINSLSTFNPPAPGPNDSAWNLLWNSRPDVAAQMVYWCYNEPTYRVNGGAPGDPATVLSTSVDAALSYGVNYIEVYQTDVLNLPGVITYARSALAPSPALPGLLNASTRLQVGLVDHVAISGFIVGGTGTKRLMLRAIGPSLSQSGITDPLADPYLELHDQTGAIIATNDNWATTEIGGAIVADQQAEILASTVAPTDPAEAAMIVDLSPGAYTAVVRGANNGTGIGLAEVYDLSQSAPATLANLSTRGFVQTGADVLIGGFILGGSGSSNVVVRALGPSLLQLGVSDALVDPTLDLRDANGTLVASNDNWADTQQAEIAASGLAPSDSREAAIEQTLSAGNYTATVSGKNGSSGVGLVEIYNLP